MTCQWGIHPNEPKLPTWVAKVRTSGVPTWVAAAGSRFPKLPTWLAETTDLGGNYRLGSRVHVKAQVQGGATQGAMQHSTFAPRADFKLVMIPQPQA